MNITVINGTEQKGCTFAMKEMFMASLGADHKVSEFFGSSPIRMGKNRTKRTCVAAANIVT